jgi:hypothetical protein
MSLFGFRSRSTWVRLVLSRAAILFLNIFFFFSPYQFNYSMVLDYSDVLTSLYVRQGSPQCS